MIALECRVRGVENLTDKLGVLPLRLRAELVKAIGESVKEIEGYARAGVKRGKTQRTANSVGSEVREFSNAVRGTVYASWYIARFLEKGVHGAVKVKPYLRRNSAVGGRRVRFAQSQVKGYTRNVNIAAKPFMRPAWERGRSATEERIAAAIQRAADEVSR